MTTTKMKSLCLREHEVRALLRCGRVLAVRVVKPQPPEGKSIWPCHYSSTGWALGEDPDVVSPAGCHCIPVRCPFDFEGNEMWVKEPASINDTSFKTIAEHFQAEVVFEADSQTILLDVHLENWLCRYENNRRQVFSPIMLPRWASRLDIEVTAVQCKRLNAIAEDEAKAAGIDASEPRQMAWNHRVGLMLLWNKLHGPDAWASNPWVWIGDLRRAKG